MTDYLKTLLLLLEKIGYHPRSDCDQEWAEMLRKCGWRRFHIERVVR